MMRFIAFAIAWYFLGLVILAFLAFLTNFFTTFLFNIQSETYRQFEFCIALITAYAMSFYFLWKTWPQDEVKAAQSQTNTDQTTNADDQLK